MFNLWKSDAGYTNKLMLYSKKEGLLSLLLWVIMCVFYAILAAIDLSTKDMKAYSVLRGCFFNLSLILLTYLFIRLNKRKLDSIGLQGGNWKTSCITGGILAIIFFIMNCGQYLLQGKSLISVEKITEFAFYYLLVAICEESIFRGYIGTRIHSIIKVKWLAVSATGLLFIVMHFPYRMIAYGMSLQALTIDNLGWIINLFVTHVILNFIYQKTNSLYGAIIPHWISNLAYNIILR